MRLNTKRVAAFVVAAALLSSCSPPKGVPTLRVAVGDNQRVVPTVDGNAHFDAIAFAALNADGSPYAGADVNVKCVPSGSMACRLTADGNTSVTVRTDERGFAIVSTRRQEFNSVVAIGGLGPLVINATLGAATATAHLLVRSPADVTILSGDKQMGSLYAQSALPVPVWAFAQPLAVAVTKYGKPLANVSVQFTCAPPAKAVAITVSQCILGIDENDNLVAHASVSTDANGTATLRLGDYGMFACGIAGTYEVTATALQSSATFHEMADGATSPPSPSPGICLSAVRAIVRR